MNKEDHTIGDFTVGKLIGEGAFSKVKLATHTSGYKVAIKIIDKKLMAESVARGNEEKAKRAKKKNGRKGDDQASVVTSSSSGSTSETLNFIEKLENEVQLLMRLDHPNIIKTYQVIDSQDECYVVMQLAAGGEMMEYLAVKKQLSEREARRLFAQLVSGLDQIHQANIVHRDLKLENLLLDENYNILISDFGLGRTFNSGVHLLDTFCGTPQFAAIEVISGIPYVGVQSDIWALGVILYYFVTGQAPFVGDTMAELYENIKAIRYKVLYSFSPHLVDLLSHILRKDPLSRISLDGIRKHPWLHMDGLMDIPTLPPRVKGKVDGSKLGQIIKSINSAHDVVVYTFNDIPRTEKDTLAIKEATRPRSHSAVLSRKKSISFNQGSGSGAFKPNLGAEHSANAALGVSLVASPDYNALVNSHLLGKAEDGASSVSNSILGKGASLNSSAGLSSHGTSSLLDSDLVSSSLNESKGSNIRRQDIIKEDSSENAVLWPSQDATAEKIRKPSEFSKTVVPIESDSGLQIRIRSSSSPTRNLDTPIISISPPVLSPTTSESPADKKKLEMAGNRRLSMVSPPNAVSVYSDFKEDQMIANLTVEGIGMENIALWHELHRPPKIIRSVKFVFRKGTFSSVLDTSTMFQDLHKVILSLPETQDKKLTFKRHPDYYDFTCQFKEEEGSEPLVFDVEICKVWLLDVHALKMKRRHGNGIKFRALYEQIVKGLNWS